MIVPSVMAVASEVFVMSVPVSIALPCSPILLEMAVRNAFITGMMTAIIGRQIQKESRYPVPVDEDPWAVIVPRPVPAPFEGTIPVVMMKNDIDTRIRNSVSISPGYNYQFRRRSKCIDREIDSYADMHAGKTSRNQEKSAGQH
jgi:hypothetical protein